MSLKSVGVIVIPDTGREFDHGAFEPTSGRVFVAHTAKDRLEVIDCASSRHLAALPGFHEAAGVVAEDGQVLVTNRGAAQLAWIDAHTLETKGTFETAVRPNGVALVTRRGLAVVACVGDDAAAPQLQVIALGGQDRWAKNKTSSPRCFRSMKLSE
jgi:hypothetical protein